jgi:hypothetical protein
MVIRLFRAKVRPGKQAEFKQAMELLSIPSLKSRSGMVACYPGQPMGANSSDFVLVTVWKDDASNQAREEWLKKFLPEEAKCLIEDFHIEGYKSFGVMEQPLKPLFKSI